MWNYEKRLQFPVNIKESNAKLAQVIISQYGGPDGEMGASMRYLSQRYASPYREVSAILTDIGTEELAHLEMVATIVMMPEVVPDVGILRCKLGAFKKCACLQVMPITQIEYELVYEKSGFWLIDNRFYNNEDMSKCHYLAEKYRTF